MKICILTHTFPRFPGDTPAPFMENLAVSIANLGHKVYVLAPYDPKYRFDVKRRYELVTFRYTFFDKLHTLGYSREFYSGKDLRVITYLLAPFLLLFGLISLIKLIKEEKIEIVSAHWIIPSGFIAATAALVTHIPFTVTIPGSDIYLGGKNIFFRLMTAFAANSASFVLSDNINYLDQLTALGIKPERKKIIVYGADTKKFAPTRKDKQLLQKLGLDVKTPVILAVGRFVAKKGFQYLIEAMPEIAKKIKNVQLVLVGDGEQRVELEALVKRLNVKESVIFVGTIAYDQLSKYYNLGDVFVMPSIKDEQGNIDASPVAMMEAMSCGTPVVATKFSGSNNLVVDGKTGYLIEEGNSKAIAQSVAAILSQKNKEQTKDIVRKTAVKNFSTKSIAQAYIEVFRSLR